jgi:hypothetical protein
MVRQTQSGENGQTDTEPDIGYHIILICIEDEV